MKYAFIKQHEDHHPAKLMCQVMGIHPSGYYAWKKQPVSARAKDNQRLLGLIKQSWLESGCVYGYRKVYDDMMDLSDVYSTPSLPLIPEQGCHPFQTKAATYSRAKLPPWQVS